MRILCVIDSLGSGGAQRQLVGLAIGFKEEEHDVTVLVYHKDNFFEELLTSKGINVVRIIKSNYFLRLRSIRKYIRRSKYDSVISFLEAPSFICEVSGFPYRNWTLIVGERNADPNIFKSSKLRIYRWFHFFSDFIVANSHANIDMVRKINPFLSNTKCRVIYNLIDSKIEVFGNKSINRSKQTFKLLVAARHEFQKNLDGLIEGVRLLSKIEKEKLEIDWYGNRIEPPYYGNYYPDGVKKINEYGLNSIFNFYPSTSRIYEEMNKADAIGLFSLYEGFPNAICEAMSIGRPVITTKTSDIDLIIEDGVSGIIIEDFNPQSISKAISKLLSISREGLDNMGQQAKIKARSTFDKNKIVQHYLDLLANKYS